MRHRGARPPGHVGHAAGPPGLPRPRAANPGSGAASTAVSTPDIIAVRCHSGFVVSASFWKSACAASPWRVRTIVADSTASDDDTAGDGADDDNNASSTAPSLPATPLTAGVDDDRIVAAPREEAGDRRLAAVRLVSPSEAATCRRTDQSPSVSRAVTAVSIDPSPLASHRSDRRTADVRTSRDESSSALRTSAASMRSMPSSVHSACSRVRASGAAVASPSTPAPPTRRRARPAAAAPCPATSRSDATVPARAAPASPSTAPARRPAASCRARCDRCGPWPIGCSSPFAHDVVAQVPVMKPRCWMMPRYMSTTYSVPSGALDRYTGRNRSSVEARNSASVVGLPRRATWCRCPDDDPADEIPRGLRDEDVPVEVGRQAIAAVDQRGADRRECGERPVRTQDCRSDSRGSRRAWRDRPDGVDLVRLVSGSSLPRVRTRFGFRP